MADKTVSVAGNNLSERSEAGKLGISFVKTRNSWYGTSPHGGGGSSLVSFKSNKALAGSNQMLQARQARRATSSFRKGSRLEFDEQNSVGDDLTMQSGMNSVGWA